MKGNNAENKADSGNISCKDRRLGNKARSNKTLGNKPHTAQAVTSSASKDADTKGRAN